MGTLPSYKSHIYKYHREFISKSFDKKDIFSHSNDDSINSFTFPYADDYAFEHERTNNNNNENFQSTNECDEEMEVDYPLFTKKILQCLFKKTFDLFV